MRTVRYGVSQYSSDAWRYNMARWSVAATATSTSTQSGGLQRERDLELEPVPSHPISLSPLLSSLSCTIHPLLNSSSKGLLNSLQYKSIT